MDKLDIAAALMGAHRVEESNARKAVATTVTGIAHGDSSDGVVYVDLGGDVVSQDGSQYVPVSTTQDVRDGDTVIVTLSGPDGTAKGITVSGVPGGGDRTREEIRTIGETADGLSTLVRETADGVEVGKSADGKTWSTTRTRMGASAFEVLTRAGEAASSFGEKIIELGKSSSKAIIKFCAGNGSIGFDTASRQLYLSGTNGAYLARQADIDNYSDFGIGLVDDLSGSAVAIIEADKYRVAGIDLTHERMRTAIQPVVLYNGGAALDYDTPPGPGTTGTVTLSEDVSNFKEMTIFYRCDITESSVTLPSPNGRYAGLYLMFVGADGNLWIKTRNVYIGRTSITNNTKAANLAFSLTNGACLFAQSRSTPEIIVDRVEGRR